MEFEAAKDAAKRMGVTVRAIQKWAKQGRLPGAYFDNRVWRIPKHIAEPIKSSDIRQPTAAVNRLPLPLLRSSYRLGDVMEFIENISDSDDRNIALAEYYYYTGNAEKAVEIAEIYIGSRDSSLRWSASVLCTFANIFRGHIHIANFISEYVLREIEEGLQTNSTREMHAFGILTANIGRELLNINVPETPPLEEYLHYLPQGIRLFGCYILAYKAYNEKNYERAIAICDTALAVCGEFYPVASVYVLIVAAASLMSLKRPTEAKKKFEKAWEFSRADGFIRLFGVHHRLLQGLNEMCIKNSCNDEFRQITRIVKEFNDGWYRLHGLKEDDYSHTLTPTELSIALLYNSDWYTKEIAAHLNLSENTVKKHIQNIFDKMGVKKKIELQKYFSS